MSRLPRILLAATFGAALALPAAAQVGGPQLVVTGQDEPWVTRQVVAHLGDLDLTRSADAREAMARIHLAASRACSPIDGALAGPAQFEVFNSCVRRAEARAAADIRLASLG